MIFCWCEYSYRSAVALTSSACVVYLVSCLPSGGSCLLLRNQVHSSHPYCRLQAGSITGTISYCQIPLIKSCLFSLGCFLPTGGKTQSSHVASGVWYCGRSHSWTSRSHCWVQTWRCGSCGGGRCRWSSHRPQAEESQGRADQRRDEVPGKHKLASGLCLIKS